MTPWEMNGLLPGLTSTMPAINVTLLRFDSWNSGPSRGSLQTRTASGYFCGSM